MMRTICTAIAGRFIVINKKLSHFGINLSSAWGHGSRLLLSYLLPVIYRGFMVISGQCIRNELKSTEVSEFVSNSDRLTSNGTNLGLFNISFCFQKKMEECYGGPKLILLKEPGGLSQLLFENIFILKKSHIFIAPFWANQSQFWAICDTPVMYRGRLYSPGVTSLSLASRSARDGNGYCADIDCKT